MSTTVSRWGAILATASASAAMTAVAYASPASAATTSQLRSAACIPTNNTLKVPLTGFVNTLEGALGGLLFLIVVLVIIAMGTLAVVLIVTKHAPKFLQKMGLAAAVPIGMIVLIVIYTGLIGALNNAC